MIPSDEGVTAAARVAYAQQVTAIRETRDGGHLPESIPPEFDQLTRIRQHMCKEPLLPVLAAAFATLPPERDDAPIVASPGLVIGHVLLCCDRPGCDDAYLSKMPDAGDLTLAQVRDEAAAFGWTRVTEPVPDLCPAHGLTGTRS